MVIVRKLALDLIASPSPDVQYRRMSGHSKDDTLEGWVDKDAQVCRNSEHCPLIQNHWPLHVSGETFCGPRVGPACDVETLVSFVRENVENVLHIDKVELIAEGAALLEAISQTVNRPVQPDIHIFHTTGSQSGSYGWHFDDTDVLIYCLHGKKRFRVAGRDMESPVTLDVELEPGKAVYIPSKWYHNGIGLSPNSTVLSLSFLPETRDIGAGGAHSTLYILVGIFSVAFASFVLRFGFDGGRKGRRRKMLRRTTKEKQ